MYQSFLNLCKKISIIVVIIIASATISSQEIQVLPLQRPINSIGLNGFGYGSKISITYEYLSIISPNLILSSKLGVGFSEEFNHNCFPADYEKIQDLRQYFTIPHNVTLNWGAGNNFFEFGMGGTVILMVSNNNYILYPIIGYRFQPLNSNNINFKFFLNYPIFGYNDNDNHYFSLYGLSFGFCF